MATLYTPTITYDHITDPFALRANPYQIERSPGDTFIYECVVDPNTGFPTSLHQRDSIVIAIAGSYKSDRFCYPGPRAGYSVFVGPGNALNIYGEPVPKVQDQWMTLQRGETAAAVAALKIVLHLLEKGMVAHGTLRKVILKTDSEGLTRSVTDWVFTWMRKGWLACGNSRVRDWDLWDELLKLLQEVQGRWGVEVSIWWVPTAWNKTAKRAAHMGTRVPPPVAAQPAQYAYSSPESFEVEMKG